MLWELIKKNMLLHRGKTIGEGKARMTYEEAVIFAEAFAQRLQAPCCGILCVSEMSAALALLSCLAAGVTAMPLSYRYGHLHCKRILEKIKPPMVITDTGGELHTVDIDGGEYIDDSENRPALLLCTSGTTGSPKGVMLSRENILTNLRDIEAYFEIDQWDKILILRPLYHCAVLTGEFLISLLKGLDIRFYSEKLDPSAVLELVRDHGITVLGGTPTLLQLLGRYALAGKAVSLRCIAVSGECLGKAGARHIRAAFPNALIYHVYGLTEASPRVAWLPPRYFDTFAEYVGLPLNSVEIKIADEQGKPLPLGQEGELCIRGRSVMTGYYREPEQTRRVLRGGWLHTGDMACIGENGFLRIRSRKDDMIIRAGMNIYPQEIENALKEDDRVEEVLAYGIKDELSGARIGLKVKGSFAGRDEVLALCREKLPPYERPAVIELVTQLPKNGSGKLLRGKIK